MAGSAAAATGPKAGDFCTSADLGKRRPVVKTAFVEPTITHFKGYYITAGSTGSQTVTVKNETTITVEVGLDVKLSAEFGSELLGKVGASVGLSVKTTASATSSETQTITWDFRNPGHYGLYQGTRKITGEYASLNCNRVVQSSGTVSTQWVERPGSTYTTFSTIEEGAVRCEDTVPADSIMRKAQEHLGCKIAPSDKSARKALKPAVTPSKFGPLDPGTLPPGFTCDTPSSGAYAAARRTPESPNRSSSTARPANA
ncbi:hypothetical protein [Streptomyces hiroshimensis]|nr:hypothetical protein [Streptomyces hiroshimensis]